MTSDLNPIAIILVTSGTRGCRLHFRYPYTRDGKEKPKVNVNFRNPYAIKIKEGMKDFKKDKSAVKTSIKDGVLVGFSNNTLATLLSTHSKTHGRKLSVEIDDVRFLGYPMSLSHLYKDSHLQSSQNLSSKQRFINSVNVVFAVRNTVSKSVVNCYQELAEQLTVAIAHEERRCQYLTKQSKVMMSAIDEASVAHEDNFEAALGLIIHNSQLGKELKQTFDSVKETGRVLFYLNQWVEIDFCLPPKIHAMHMPGRTIHLEQFYRCLSYLRPYHGILLTKSEEELMSSLPLDACPSLTRVIKLTTPVKNLKTLALETDVSITQIYQVVCHMVYWGFAIIIYPLCQANLYVLSPSANTSPGSKLCQDFSEKFADLNLHVEMDRFSLSCRPLDVLTQQYTIEQLNKVTVWLLQHRLLNQLHTYVNLIPPRKKQFSSMTPHKNLNSSTLSSNSTNAQVRMAELSECGTVTQEQSFSEHVVEESYYSILMEDPATSTLDRTASMSDAGSLNSDESGVPSSNVYTSQLSKSPPLANSDSSLPSEEAKTQWGLQNSLLNELKPEVKDIILRCPSSSNAEDLKLFARLCPYFNGKHHLEEMMYYEDLMRSTLMALLDKYKEVLIFCTHVDSATSLL